MDDEDFRKVINNLRLRDALPWTLTDKELTYLFFKNINPANLSLTPQTLLLTSMGVSLLMQMNCPHQRFNFSLEIFDKIKIYLDNEAKAPYYITSPTGSIAVTYSEEDAFWLKLHGARQVPNNYIM